MELLELHSKKSAPSKDKIPSLGVLRERGRSHKVPRSISGCHFFIFASFGLVFGYCGANGCYFNMLKFQDSTPGDNCPGNNCHGRQLTITQPFQARFKWDKAKLVYSNSTIQLATKLPQIGGKTTQVTTAQATSAIGDN